MALTNQKQSPIPVVPRQMQITNPDGTPTRSGQLLLQQLSSPMVAFGTPGDMANATGLPDGAIYVQQFGGITAGGGEALYQLEGGEWHYISGTVWGTISPDQRPVRLGPDDAGFDFRSIDSNPQLGGHEWIWSGSEWVEVTPNRYGSHGNRLLQPLGQTWNGMIWVETDRSGVIYQNQSGVWHYLAGTMYGTLSPDQRPADLGANDAGFQFRGTDQPREFIWSGTVWVETAAQISSLQWVAASGALTLTTAMADIPGLALTLARTGTYQVSGVIDFNINDPTALCLAQLVVAGAAQGILAIFQAANVPARATTAQQWMIVTASANTAIKLQANKSGGTATSYAHVHSTLGATWISP